MILLAVSTISGMLTLGLIFGCIIWKIINKRGKYIFILADFFLKKKIDYTIIVT